MQIPELIWKKPALENSLEQWSQLFIAAVAYYIYHLYILY